MASKASKLQSVTRFKFWSDQALQDGMRYQHSFFQCLHTLEGDDRFRLYALADQLVQQGADILVTHDQDTCSLWINLRYRDTAYSPRPLPRDLLPADFSANLSD